MKCHYEMQSPHCKRPRLDKDLTKLDGVSTKECTICTNRKPQQEFKSATSGCESHEHNICRICLVKYIITQLAGNGSTAAHLSCPSVGCGSQFSIKDLERVLGEGRGAKTVVDKYDKRLLKAALESDPAFRYCPRPKCGNGQMVADIANSTFWTCGACRSRNCIQHRDVFHAGQTCQQYDASLREMRNAEALTPAALAKLGVKRCPACRQGLEKESGCDHFTCKSVLGCGAQFCWLCLADFGPILEHGNAHHKPTCEYYA